jgi:hypothetical protein
MSEISPEAIPNRYIVVFKQHIPDEVCDEHFEWAQAAHLAGAALRAESDGPDLTGVGAKFNFPTLSGYVGSFDGTLMSEIEGREEVRSKPPPR